MSARLPLRTAARELWDIARGATATHEHFRDRLVTLVVVSLGVDVVCTVLAFLFERHAPRSQVTNLGDAAFFASTQLLSVSSQLPNPISTAGRVLDVGMELYAITVVAYLAGAAGSFFHRRSDERRAEGSATG